MGNLLRMQLMDDRDVLFVGYKHPHPLTHHILLKVQTTTEPTGSHGKNPYLPTDALEGALRALLAEVHVLIEQVGDGHDPSRGM